MTDRRDESIQIARLEERMVAMRDKQLEQGTKMAEIEGKIDLIVTALSEAKGGWRLLMLIGGMASTLGGAVAWALTHIGVK